MNYHDPYFPLFSCNICGKKLVNDNNRLGDHVRKTHHMSIQTYREKYGAEEESDGPVHGGRKGASSLPEIDNPRAHYDVISSSLGDLCLCKCSHCNKELFHHHMATHVQYHHGITENKDKSYSFLKKTYHRLGLMAFCAMHLPEGCLVQI
jgi:hypothetical protein